ncbi:hypothetical protein JYU14_04380 [Simkania negevensis]|uniref:Uncharacterized protein n=1 Tax=Simkania negevensis TaxID=83561 RepID=A0ABS3ARC9_9BACT|nr:hypothetical protein [Simkania negevensis]
MIPVTTDALQAASLTRSTSSDSVEAKTHESSLKTGDFVRSPSPSPLPSPDLKEGLIGCSQRIARLVGSPFAILGDQPPSRFSFLLDSDGLLFSSEVQRQVEEKERKSLCNRLSDVIVSIIRQIEGRESRVESEMHIRDLIVKLASSGEIVLARRAIDSIANLQTRAYAHVAFSTIVPPEDQDAKDAEEKRINRLLELHRRYDFDRTYMKYADSAEQERNSKVVSTSVFSLRSNLDASVGFCVLESVVSLTAFKSSQKAKGILSVDALTTTAASSVVVKASNDLRQKILSQFSLLRNEQCSLCVKETAIGEIENMLKKIEGRCGHNVFQLEFVKLLLRLEKFDLAYSVIVTRPLYWQALAFNAWLSLCKPPIPKCS